MSICLMMVCFNRLELTQQTLPNVIKTTDLPFHLVVIDNNSQDSTVEWVESYLNSISSEEFPNFLGFKFIKNSENLGIATGRNQALYHSYTEDDWLATLDNDILLPENWASKCVNILKAQPKYGSIGVNFEDVNYPIIDYEGIKVQHKKEGNLGGACTVFSRKIHKLIGYFNNKDYTKYYCPDDADFGFRLRVAGFQLGYIAENGTHLGMGQQDVGAYRQFKDEEYAKSKQLFFANCRLYLNKQKSIYIPYKE